MEAFEAILNTLEPISLEEMDNVQLLNRTDTKFVFAQTDLAEILKALKKDYKVLEIAGIRTNKYRSLYYDTPEYKFFYDHHNGRNNRVKVRFREYLDSDLCFLEIKRKHKGRTIKSRTKVEAIPNTLSQEQQAFVDEAARDILQLQPALWNSFTRMTLVHRKEKERLTIDCNLTFKLQEKEDTFSNLVIAEVKQERVNRNSSFMKLMKAKGVRPFRISKYCMGLRMMLPSMKSNIFKAKELAIKKISNAATV